ncbi:tripartite ATP-independent transporter DctM subunit [Sporosarcina luteola]|nr:tripartite ATP-independent transporter DctM subunit [Sporosarcina luteola]
MEIGFILLGLLVVLIFLGIPIAFAIGIASLAAIVYGGLPISILAQRSFAGIDSFPLLAVPFFLLAGNLMTAGGINERILRFCMALVGWIRGSLGIVTVVASALFASISGSGVATVSSIGGITIPAMKKNHYDPSFAAAVASASSILGPLIPPSIFLIVYANSVQMSVKDLFIGAVFPGIMVAIVFILYTYYYAKKHNIPSDEKLEGIRILRESKNSFWALLMPVIILGGIFGGIFTPTEAAAVSVVYAFIIGAFVYKEIKWKNLMTATMESCVSTAIILLLLATSNVSGWVVVASNLPATITEAFLSISGNAIVLFLLINLLLLFVGMILEANAAIVILVPILLPIVTALGMTPLQFGIVMSVNLCIGLITPPVGVCLLLGNDIAQTPFEKTFKRTMPFILLAIAVLLLITYVPFFTTWLPSVL